MSRIIHLLLVLGVPVLLTAVNVRGLATQPYLGAAFARRGFPSAAGMTDAERLALATISTRFIVSSAEPDTLLSLRQAGRTLYTVEEVGHLLDVRRVVGSLTGLAVAAAVVTALGAASWYLGGDVARLGLGLQRGGWLTLAIVGLLGAGIVIAWPVMFTLFHELLFPPGTWQFPVDSGLIRLFPERFWSDAAAAWLGLTIAECVALIAAGRWLERHPRPCRQAVS